MHLHRPEHAEAVIGVSVSGRLTRDILFVQLGAQFPKPEGPEAIIDVSLFDERQLTAVSGDTYPLIIRLECVSDKGKTESHQLQVHHP